MAVGYIVWYYSFRKWFQRHRDRDRRADTARTGHQPNQTAAALKLPSYRKATPDPEL
jgi:hypothetical protein